MSDYDNSKVNCSIGDMPIESTTKDVVQQLPVAPKYGKIDLKDGSSIYFKEVSEEEYMRSIK